jgi:hypothetical protein
MARYGRLLTDAQWEKIRRSVPCCRRDVHPGAGAATGERSQSSRRYSVDFAQRCSLAGPHGKGTKWAVVVARRVIADRAYDSDPLRARLAARGIELIAPHRWNRSKPRQQDGRALRRYRRRWKVERVA